MRIFLHKYPTIIIKKKRNGEKKLKIKTTSTHIKKRKHKKTNMA